VGVRAAQQDALRAAASSATPSAAPPASSRAKAAAADALAQARGVITHAVATGAPFAETMHELAAVGRNASYDAVSGLQLGWLWSAFARIRELGPPFAEVWRERSQAVAAEIRRSASRAGASPSWTAVAPDAARLVELGGDQKWSDVVIQGGVVLGALDTIASNGTTTARTRLVRLVARAVGGGGGSAGFKGGRR